MHFAAEMKSFRFKAEAERLPDKQRGCETTQREKQHKDRNLTNKTNLKRAPWLRAAQTHTGHGSFLPLCNCELIPSVMDTTCVTVSSVQLSYSTDGVTTATMKKQRT